MAQSRQSYIADIVSACMLLSRLPCGWYKFDDKNPPRLDMAGWAFPIIGFVIGAIGAASLITMQAIGIGALGAAACGVVAMTLLSGALHDDGLADMADGFGGGRTVDDKIHIMHDSRVGQLRCYGALPVCCDAGELAVQPRRPAHRTIFICAFNGVMGGGIALANIGIAALFSCL